MVSPAQKIKLVRENLALAMALWKAAANGHIGPNDLVDRNADNGECDQVSAPNSLDRAREDKLTRSAGNQVRASFALAVTQTQQSLDSVFSVDPLDEEAPDLQAARCAMYLLNAAMATDMFSPVWDCPPRYRRLLEVRPIRFVLDANEIQGRVLNWEHFGGLEKFLYLLDYCESWVEQPGEDLRLPSPSVQARDTDSPRRRSLFDEVASGAADSVEEFLSTRCELGEGFRSTAKDLYASYLGWCKETGQQPVAQRSFGMRLTGQGLERRRRGRGKHWWEGIRLSGVPELAMTVRRNGVH